jgi:hypothetical protein
MMTKLAAIAVAALTVAFSSSSAPAQEKAKGEKASGRTVAVFVDNDARLTRQ